MNYTNLQHLLSLLIFIFLIHTAFSNPDYLSLSKDTYLSPSNKDTNYGSETLISFSSSITALMEVDLSSLSSKCPTTAALEVYTSSSNVNGKSVQIFHIQANWEETTVTYNNFNEIDYSSVLASFVAKGGGVYQLSLNNSMLLKAMDTESSQVVFFFFFCYPF